MPRFLCSLDTQEPRNGSEAPGPGAGEQLEGDEGRSPEINLPKRRASLLLRAPEYRSSDRRTFLGRQKALDTQ